MWKRKRKKRAINYFLCEFSRMGLLDENCAAPLSKSETADFRAKLEMKNFHTDECAAAAAGESSAHHKFKIQKNDKKMCQVKC